MLILSIIGCFLKDNTPPKITKSQEQLTYPYTNATYLMDFPPFTEGSSWFYAPKCREATDKRACGQKIYESYDNPDLTVDRNFILANFCDDAFYPACIELADSYASGNGIPYNPERANQLWLTSCLKLSRSPASVQFPEIRYQRDAACMMSTQILIEKSSDRLPLFSQMMLGFQMQNRNPLYWDEVSSNVTYWLLLTKQPDNAIRVADGMTSKDSEAYHVALTNKISSLAVIGRLDDAKQVYEEYSSLKIQGGTLKSVLLSDAEILKPIYSDQQSYFEFLTYLAPDLDHILSPVESTAPEQDPIWTEAYDLYKQGQKSQSFERLEELTLPMNIGETYIFSHLDAIENLAQMFQKEQEFLIAEEILTFALEERKALPETFELELLNVFPPNASLEYSQNDTRCVVNGTTNQSLDALWGGYGLLPKCPEGSSPGTLTENNIQKNVECIIHVSYRGTVLQYDIEDNHSPESRDLCSSEVGSVYDIPSEIFGFNLNTGSDTFHPSTLSTLGKLVLLYRELGDYNLQNYYLNMGRQTQWKYMRVDNNLPEVDAFVQLGMDNFHRNVGGNNADKRFLNSEFTYLGSDLRRLKEMSNFSTHMAEGCPIARPWLEAKMAGTELSFSEYELGYQYCIFRSQELSFRNLDIAQKSQQPSLIGQAYQNIGKVYSAHSMMTTSLLAFDKSLEYLDEDSPNYLSSTESLLNTLMMQINGAEIMQQYFGEDVFLSQTREQLNQYYVNQQPDLLHNLTTRQITSFISDAYQISDSSGSQGHSTYENSGVLGVLNSLWSASPNDANIYTSLLRWNNLSYRINSTRNLTMHSKFDSTGIEVIQNSYRDLSHAFISLNKTDDFAADILQKAFKADQSEKAYLQTETISEIQKTLDSSSNLDQICSALPENSILIEYKDLPTKDYLPDDSELRDAIEQYIVPFVKAAQNKSPNQYTPIDQLVLMGSEELLVETNDKIQSWYAQAEQNAKNMKIYNTIGKEMKEQYKLYKDLATEVFLISSEDCDTIHRVPLTDSALIAFLVKDYRRKLTIPTIPEMALKPASNMLYKSVWEPITQYIPSNANVFIVADGEAGNLPFATLLDENNRYLIEKHPLHYLVHASDLLKPDKQYTNQDLVLVGGVDYGDQLGVEEPSEQELRNAPCITSKFGYLPGSKIEVEAINQSLAGRIPTITMLGKEATETNVLNQITSARYAHLATHGFFATNTCSDQIASVKPDKPNTVMSGNYGDLFDPQNKSEGLLVEMKTLKKAQRKFPDDKSSQCRYILTKEYEDKQLATNVNISECFFMESDEPRIKFTLEYESTYNGPVDKTLLNLSPMSMNGLVLANANNRTDDMIANDDGIITAEELRFLNLHNLEFLILSACETGLGTSKVGDSTQGLQQALLAAGVDTLVLSLWAVDDNATNQLMQYFYEERFGSKDVSEREGLRAAQLRLLNEYRSQGHSQPGKWGAFFTTGNYR